MYPIPPHLNHMGADIARGLLEFSDGKKLGVRGFRWLKIHLANKMGKDKLSNDDRLKYISTIEDEIRNIAYDPIKWDSWLELEDCWQTLSAIFEY